MMSFALILTLLVLASVRINSNSIGVDNAGKSNAKAGCRCVPWYQCDDSGHIITDGAGLIDPRKSNNPDVSPRDPNCQNSNDVCCFPPSDDKLIQSTPPDTELTHQCGTRKTKEEPVNARILNNGRSGATQIGEFPWQVALLRTKDGVKYFTAAGVLIDGEHILTAAHKVVGFSPQVLTVRVAAWNLTTENEIPTSRDMEVSSVTIHPNYNNASMKNGLAVVTLASKVEYAVDVETICLPEDNENHDGKQCVVTGWGKDAFEAGKHSEVLKQVPVPILNFEKCQTALRKTRLGELFELHESFICAGGEQGFDACSGDGGGPLVCLREDGTYGLMGLVSWGIDCGQPGIPGVYVNIPHFVEWITSVTKRPLISYWPSA